MNQLIKCNSSRSSQMSCDTSVLELRKRHVCNWKINAPWVLKKLLTANRCFGLKKKRKCALSTVECFGRCLAIVYRMWFAGMYCTCKQLACVFSGRALVSSSVSVSELLWGKAFIPLPLCPSPGAPSVSPLSWNLKSFYFPKGAGIKTCHCYSQHSPASINHLLWHWLRLKSSDSLSGVPLYVLRERVSEQKARRADKSPKIEWH